MLGSAVEPVTMATRPENLCAEVRPGDVGSADAMSGILSQVELSRHVVFHHAEVHRSSADVGHGKSACGNNAAARYRLERKCGPR